MKILIGILACKRDREYEQIVRDTWLKRFPVGHIFFIDQKPHSVDYGFFVGHEVVGLAADEISLPCPDGRGIRDAVPKTHALVQYAWLNNYDFLFKCDLDTYVHVPRLLASGFENYDWSGYGQPYGGSGYWLSRKAMEQLLDKPTNTLICEDWWVAGHLEREGFVAHQDDRYHSKGYKGPESGRPAITFHLYTHEDGSNVHWQERINSFKKICLNPREE